VTVLPFQTPAEVEAAIPHAVRHLEAGRLLAYPTETIYGLGSRAIAVDVQALHRMKGRREGKPFLLLVSETRMAEACGLVFTGAANALARRFWPGPLTLVLAGGEGRLPDLLRGPEHGIAVRWTSQSGIAHLVARLGVPITSTSANRPGGATAPGAAAVVEIFPEAVTVGTLLVLDGGTLGNRPPSTVIDCTSAVPRLVREGALPLSELRRAVGRFGP
jgi:L-threonylcarbamoyladenylate synthase